MKRLVVLSLLSAVALLLSIPPLASGQADICPALVEEALLAVGNNCTGLGRNSVCYGYNQVSATFAQTQADDFFTLPADRAELVSLETIQTSPLDVDQSEWGIAVMDVQADLPSALPGQGVLFLLLGDVTLENQAPSDAEGAFGPIPVTTLVNLNLRSGPTTRANVLGSLPTGTTVIADRRSEAGDWVRVVFDDIVGWVSTEFVSANGDLLTLPTLEDAPLGAMQAFRLETAITGLRCAEAPPSLLVIQGPQDVQVQLSINGLEFSLGSTAVFQTTDAETLQIGVLDGELETDDGTVIEEGFTGLFTLDPTGFVVQTEEPEVRPFTQDELDDLRGLDNFPSELMHYPIQVPEQPGRTQPPPPQVTAQPVVTQAPGVPTFTPTPTLAGQTIVPLTVTTSCVQDYYLPRDFTTFNPNAFEVPISWAASTGESAFFFAPPNSSVVRTIAYPEILARQEIFDITFTIDWGTGTASAISEWCPPQQG
ncbi:MAG: SH3 domain-containing protein [Chloroflexota bacterium]|nr:SH3 domain-containing protein [Chloroflexota bacterium]